MQLELRNEASHMFHGTCRCHKYFASCIEDVEPQVLMGLAHADPKSKKTMQIQCNSRKVTGLRSKNLQSIAAMVSSTQLCMCVYVCVCVCVCACGCPFVCSLPILYLNNIFAKLLWSCTTAFKYPNNPPKLFCRQMCTGSGT